VDEYGEAVFSSGGSSWAILKLYLSLYYQQKMRVLTGEAGF